MKYLPELMQSAGWGFGSELPFAGVDGKYADESGRIFTIDVKIGPIRTAAAVDRETEQELIRMFALLDMIKQEIGRAIWQSME